MLFSSISFLYYFLPITILVYTLIPEKKCVGSTHPMLYKNAVLLIASFFFYAWGEPRFCLLLLYAICVGYLGGMILAKTASSHLFLRRFFLILFLLLILGSLFFFKYYNFFGSTFNSILGPLPGAAQIPLLRIALPIGISFYSFQIVSYLADVYLGNVKACRSFLQFATYISFFPQLIAGPIVRYQDLENALPDRHTSQADNIDGIKRFLTGLAKKVLLADSFGQCVASLDAGEQTTLGLWLIAITYTLQIYFDFSGYSDMAIGLGRMFGFHFPENFTHPYESKSITEFWRRWHITLGRFFRDYVYIPLGGNRVSFLKWICNVFIVWFFSGLWHGASMNFVLWGLFYGVFLVLEKLFLGKWLQKHSITGHLYTLFVVIIGFVLFRTENLEIVLQQLIGMFTGHGSASTLWSVESLYYLKSYWFLILMGCIGATSFPRNSIHKLFTRRSLAHKPALEKALSVLWFAVLLFLITAYLVSGSFQAFLYFRF